MFRSQKAARYFYKVLVLFSAAGSIVLLSLAKLSYAFNANNPLADYQALINQASRQPVTNGSQSNGQANSNALTAAQTALQSTATNSTRSFNNPALANNTANQTNATSQLTDQAQSSPPNIFVTPNSNLPNKSTSSVIHY